MKNHNIKQAIRATMKARQTGTSFKARYSTETVEITDPQSNDHWPYFVCPKCGGGNITRAFQRCIDCGVKLNWRNGK